MLKTEGIKPIISTQQFLDILKYAHQQGNSSETITAKELVSKLSAKITGEGVK
ncbi:hypothetical protein ACSVDA_07360 [Cytobacillus sp. Hm23]|uniref:hypothetical protein n=1 Tax=Cytobacillus sp. IB215665 TaxID=3097357 RepID=UPI002A0D45A6|nr:hypothetical protein [Cytobacillus sp. IB215665]MDX8363756.1 hypothetical protein [Cytobacillus sp. IB215665]